MIGVSCVGVCVVEVNRIIGSSVGSNVGSVDGYEVGICVVGFEVDGSIVGS